jgi:hypothetical protein
LSSVHCVDSGEPGRTFRLIPKSIRIIDDDLSECNADYTIIVEMATNLR